VATTVGGPHGGARCEAGLRRRLPLAVRNLWRPLAKAGQAPHGLDVVGRRAERVRPGRLLPGSQALPVGGVAGGRDETEGEVAPGIVAVVEVADAVVGDDAVAAVRDRRFAGLG